MAYVRANGVEFHVQRLAPRGSRGSSQSRQTVVFVHGLVIDSMSSYFYTLANPVAHAGAEVILYDLRGHGRSERPPSGYTLDDSVADLDALLDALGIDRPVHLVGNSYGGTVVLGLAIARPQRVASAALLDPHYFVQGLSLVNTPARDKEIQRWLAEEGGRKLAALAERIDALSRHTTFIGDMTATMAKPWREEDLRSIPCPVLAIYGEHSDIVDRAAYLPHLIPDCRVVILPDCTHFVIVEASGALRDLILRWFTDQGVASPSHTPPRPAGGPSGAAVGGGCGQGTGAAS
jgi:pimeloyl-ACP methyl ester carboxylesterase